MRKIQLTFLLFLSVTTAFAERKEKPIEEPHCYLFLSKCGKTHQLVFHRDLTDIEYAYYQGFYDALCDRGIYTI